MLIPRCSQRLPDSHPRNRERDSSRERDKNRERERRGGRGATPTRRTGSSRQIPGWLWLVAGIGGGMLITSLMKISSAPDATGAAGPTVSTASKEVTKGVSKVAPVAVKKPAETRPVVVAAETRADREPVAKGGEVAVEPATRFDFYTLLPEREVIVPEREAAAPAKPSMPAPAASSTAATPAAVAAVPVVAGGESYLLQAGSFRGNADAERRRAQIAALGLQARIEMVRAGTDTWYRVHAGPFNSRDQLATARDRLSAEGIETLQIRQK